MEKTFCVVPLETKDKGEPSGKPLKDRASGEVMVDPDPIEVSDFKLLFLKFDLDNLPMRLESSSLKGNRQR